MLDIINKTRQFYDEAGVYFSKTRQKKYGENSLWPEIREYTNRVEGGDKVLDLGCGNGRLLTGLPDNVNYLGVDFSETLVNEAKKLHKENKFMVADILDQQFWQSLRASKYDAIFSVAVMHHIPTKRQQIELIRNMASHIKRGGFIYISVWNLWQRRYLPNHIQSLFLKLQNIRLVNVPFQNKWNRTCFTYDAAYMKKLINHEGLQIRKIEYVDREGKKSDRIGGNNLIIELVR